LEPFGPDGAGKEGAGKVGAGGQRQHGHYNTCS
jgi:hypothetical protein